MKDDEKIALIEWCVEHEYRLLAIYHDRARIFWPVSVWDRNGGWYVSAFDHTHRGEDYTRTYHLETMEILGISRKRSVSIFREE